MYETSQQFIQLIQISYLLQRVRIKESSNYREFTEGSLCHIVLINFRRALE